MVWVILVINDWDDGVKEERYELNSFLRWGDKEGGGCWVEMFKRN
jgi:hypothetical protein